MYTAVNALQDAPNSTRWRTPSSLDCMLPSTLSGGSQDALKYTLEHTPKYNLKTPDTPHLN